MTPTRTVSLTVLAVAFVVRAAFAADLVVVEKVSGLVSFYSDSGHRLAQVQVGVHPHEMIRSLDKRFVYVTNNNILWMTEPGGGGNTISIIDVASMQEAGRIDLGEFRRPHGIDIHPKTGMLVVTIENPDGLLIVDPVERKVIKYLDTKGKAPHMVALDQQGQWAYVSNTGSATLAAINLSNGVVRLAPTGPRPQGSVLSKDGRVCYVTDYGGTSLTLIDTATMKVMRTIETGKAPVRIALTPNGKTFVYAMYEDQAVGFIDASTNEEIDRIDLDGKPVSLTLSDDGQLAYASAQAEDKIFVISVPNRRIVRILETPKGAGPDPVLEIERK